MKNRLHEPFIFIYEYISATLLNETGLTSPYISKIGFKRFMETYLEVTNFEGSVNIKLEKDLYKIPHLSTFASFKTLFEEALAPLPRIDNPLLLGLHRNQEMLSTYTQSKELFKILTNYFGDAKIEELEEKLLSKQVIGELVESIKTESEDELLFRVSKKSVEYSMMISAASEQQIKILKERISIIEGTIEAFGQKLFEEMATELQNSTDANKMKSEAVASLSNPKQNPFSAYKSHEMDSMRSGGFSPDRRDDSRSANSEATIQESQVNQVKNKFKNSFLSHEMKTLKEISVWMLQDLNIMRTVLRTDANSGADYFRSEILVHFYNNQVPPIWKNRLTDLNINLENFASFLRSLLLKIDQLYNLIVMLKCELPPVIPINRLLDPQSLFVNYLNVTAGLKGLNFYHCVFVLSKWSHNPKGSSQLGYNQNSQGFRINGLRIRGGAIDDSTGLLVEEHPREFESPLDILTVEIIQAPPIPSPLLMEYQDEIPHLPFLLHHPDHKNTLNLRNSFYQTQWDTQFQKMDCLSLKHSQNTGVAQHEIKSRLKRQLTSGPELETEELHSVRVPVYLSTFAGVSPLGGLQSYLYLFSKIPQVDWTNKCTFACLDNL